jgi:hypothetical protein
VRRLPLPADDAAEVYVLCISKVRNLRLRSRLARVRRHVVAAAAQLSAAGNQHAFYTMKPKKRVGSAVTKDEMSAVYELRMARKGAPGRPVYDRLLVAAAHMRCPLCGQRTVSTLDHYMPRRFFPALSVVPINLVPACSDCNKLKLDAVAADENRQLLHPYFDDVDSVTWLRAVVEESNPTSLEFSVAPPAVWDNVTTERMRHHFSILRLGVLYRSHAAAELLNIKHSISLLFHKAGIDGVREHLLTEAESRRMAQLNSWQAAMYSALASSAWYCGGGFWN